MLITDEYLHFSPPSYSNASAPYAGLSTSANSRLRRYAESRRRELPGSAGGGSTWKLSLRLLCTARRRVRRTIHSRIAREVANARQQGNSASGPSPLATGHPRSPCTANGIFSSKRTGLLRIHLRGNNLCSPSPASLFPFPFMNKAGTPSGYLPPLIFT